MTIPRQDRELLLNKGLDVKQSDAFQSPETATQVDNLRFDQQGELVKWNGPASSTAAIAVPTGSAYTNALVESLFTRGDEVIGLTADHGLVRVDPTAPTTTLYTAREFATTQAADAIPKYMPKACRVSRKVVDRSQYTAGEQGISASCSTVYDGVLVSCWATFTSTTGGTINFKATDVDTGAVLASKQYLTLASTTVLNMKAIPYTVVGSEGALFAILTGGVAPYTIFSYLYNASTRDFAAGTTQTTNARYIYFDLKAAYSGTSYYLAFTDNTTGFVKAQLRTNSAVTTTHDATVSGVSGLSMQVASGGVLIAMGNSTTTVVADIFGTPSATAVFTASGSELVYGIALGYIDATHFMLYANTYYNAATPTLTRVSAKPIITTGWAAPSVAGVTTIYMPNAWLAAAPFTFDSRLYVIVCPSPASDVLSSAIVVRYGEFTSNGDTKAYHEPVARLIHNRFFSLLSFTLGTHPTSTVVDNKVHLVLPGDIGGGIYSQTLFHSTIEFAATGEALPLPYAEVGPMTHVASGVLFDFDGETPSEHTPLKAPVVEIDASSGTGTSFAVDDAMVAIYTWVDGHGNLHRSAPSPVVHTGVVSNKQVDVYVQKPMFAAYGTRGPAAECYLYLTEDGGSNYYRASSGGSRLFPTSYSDTHWKFTDVDAGDPGEEPLYSTGTGGTERVPTPPPALRDVTEFQDRLVGIDAEDPTRVWYTKPFVPGFSPEWSSLQTLTINADCMAVRENNGTLAVLAADSIWAVEGSGPDALGNGSFALPRKVANTGCIDTTSVCVTPVGIVYRSQRGYQLLGGGFDVQPIGMPLEPSTRLSSLSAYTPGRVVYDDLAQEIRVLDADGGAQYAFHIGEQKWTKLTSVVPADMVSTRDGVWYLTAAQTQICREFQVGESSTSTNSSVYRTPYISINGLAGAGHIWELVLEMRVRANVSNSTLTVLYETRGPYTASETFSWTGAELAALGSDIIDLRIVPTQAKCKSFRLRITETCSGAYAGSSPLVLSVGYGAEGFVRATKTASLKGST